MKGVDAMKVNLRAARVNAGLTQKQAAEALGISKATIISYETKKTKPDIEMSQRLASLYGCTIDDIIFFTD